MNTTKEVFDRHQQAFDAGNLDAIIADYATDAILITSRGRVARGPDAIREAFVVFLSAVQGEGGETDVLTEVVEGDIAYAAWKSDSIAFATDTLIVRDGKIVAHTISVHFG